MGSFGLLDPAIMLLLGGFSPQCFFLQTSHRSTTWLKPRRNKCDEPCREELRRPLAYTPDVEPKKGCPKERHSPRRGQAAHLPLWPSAPHHRKLAGYQTDFHRPQKSERWSPDRLYLIKPMVTENDQTPFSRRPQLIKNNA